jgi:hypothetical protein
MPRRKSARAVQDAQKTNRWGFDDDSPARREREERPQE